MSCDPENFSLCRCNSPGFQGVQQRHHCPRAVYSLFIYLFIPFFPHSAFVCGNLGAAFPRCCLLSSKALSPCEANDAPEHSDLERDFKCDPDCAVVPEPFPSREKPRGAVTQPCLSHASPSRRAPGGRCFTSTRASVGDEPWLRPW